MALPKKLKKTLDLPVVDPQGGPKAYIDQYLDENPGNLPRGIDLTDLDKGFVDWVGSDLDVVVDGENVPVSFLTAQRWTEFTRTWRNSDKYKNIKIPFISVVRKPDVQPGTNPADFNIPLKDYRIPVSVIPKWDGNKKGADVYLIPQPVGVDVTYTVRFFTYRMSELNILNVKVLETFASAQAYVNIKGHYFPIMLESIGDESTIDDLDGKRYYIQTYELRMMAYVLDEDKFELRPGLERAILSFEVDTKRAKAVATFIKDDTQNDKTINCIVQFLPGSPTTLTFDSDTVASFTSLETHNVTAVTIRVNGNIVSLPFSIAENDSLGISIVRTDSTQISEIILRGTVPL
jgi:hypothetical protein